MCRNSFRLGKSDYVILCYCQHNRRNVIRRNVEVCIDLFVADNRVIRRRQLTLVSDRYRRRTLGKSVEA